MEQLHYNLLFRWFVGLSMDAPVWDPSTFNKNRDRLLDRDVAQSLLSAVVAQLGSRRSCRTSTSPSMARSSRPGPVLSRSSPSPAPTPSRLLTMARALRWPQRREQLARPETE
jgi:IS5 family transposase